VSRLGEGKEENQDDVPGMAHDGSTNDLLLSPLLCLSPGPYISVALAVYTGTPNVQILNPVVSLRFHPSDSKARAAGERFICALCRLLSDLRNYYLTDAFSRSSLLQPQFPFYTTYTDGDASHQFGVRKTD